MNEIREDGAAFVGYEYKELPADGEYVHLCLDCYPSFGWRIDEHTPEPPAHGKGKWVLKRERKILNRTELTRLQRHFEACVRELEELEQSKTASAMLSAVLVGLVGTAFLAGATFAATHEPPLVPLTIVLALPGFTGWIVPVFLYRWRVRRRTRVVEALMEKKYDEIDEICEKGRRLLL